MVTHPTTEVRDALCEQEAKALDVHGRWNGTSLSNAREVIPLIEKITKAMPALGYSDTDVFATRLILEETIVNALRHGNKSDPRKRVHVRFSVRRHRLLVQVEDEGRGFDPDQVPDPTDPENLDKPTGRGLLLIRHYANWVHYNERGNCVTLCKRPSSACS
jgi:serine/threonine-protein kinase RsbW